MLGLDEIVVTARKREESLMEVPLAITAFTAEKLEAMAGRGGNTSSSHRHSMVLCRKDLSRWWWKKRL